MHLVPETFTHDGRLANILGACPFLTVALDVVLHDIGFFCAKRDNDVATYSKDRIDQMLVDRGVDAPSIIESVLPRAIDGFEQTAFAFPCMRKRIDDDDSIACVSEKLDSFFVTSRRKCTWNEIAVLIDFSQVDDVMWEAVLKQLRRGVFR